MSYSDYKEAVEVIEENKEFLDPIYKQKESDIESAEKVLNVKFPNSYKSMLQKYGCLGFLSFQIYGLSEKEHIGQKIFSNIINLINDLRNNDKLNFPHSYIPIYELGNGEITCLDTSRMNAEGECPVVSWYFGKSEDIYEDFGAFLLDIVQNAIKEQ